MVRLHLAFGWMLLSYFYCFIRPETGLSELKFQIAKFAWSAPQGFFSGLVLQQNTWDDYGLKTTYKLYDFDNIHVGREPLIGEVKILQLGQQPSSESLLDQDFEHLDSSWCSVGQSLDYYERLSQMEKPKRDAILIALRDITYFPDLGGQFSEEEGWTTSLFRGLGRPENHIAMAVGQVSGNFSSIMNDDMAMRLIMSGWGSSATFSFAPPLLADPNGFFLPPIASMPARLSVLIGRNGSGKSTVLSRLARIAHAPASQRKDLEYKLGALEPEGIGFPRVITISFSPFDTFQLPGSDTDEYEQYVSEIKRGAGRFVFIGLRDLVGEAEDRAMRRPGDGLDPMLQTNNDRVLRTRLKSFEQQTEEFSHLLKRILDRGRGKELIQVISMLCGDPSFGGIDANSGEHHLVDSLIGGFSSWSTGHKISMQIVVGLLSAVEGRSLILIDEPETHLHPPLLAVLMNTVRYILDEFGAFAVVATHSPVVLQETLAQHVQVVRREGGSFEIAPIGMETFGESIGAITSEVFRLGTYATDYHKTLESLVFSYSLSLEAMESLFMNGSMSQQARGYAISLLARKAQDRGQG